MTTTSLSPTAPLRDSAVDRAGAVLGVTVLAVFAPALVLRLLASFVDSGNGAPGAWASVGDAASAIVRLVALGILVVLLASCLAALAMTVVARVRGRDDDLESGPDPVPSPLLTASLYGLAAVVAAGGFAWLV